MPQSRVCCCSCACCNGKRAVIIYTSVFLALGVLLFYHFAPLPEAMFGATFITDDIVDDANAYCTYSDCKQLCDCNGAPCDMDEDIGMVRGFSIYMFVNVLLGFFVMLTGLLGAAKENSTLLQCFIVAIPISLLLVAIAALGLSFASDKAIRASHLHNVKEDHCTDSFFESADEERKVRTVMNWLILCIYASSNAHMTYSAKRARDDFANSGSSKCAAPVGKPVILGAVSPEGKRVALKAQLQD